MSRADRVDILAKRLTWVDRYHTAVALGFGLIAWVALTRVIARWFDADWLSIGPLIAGAVCARAAWEIIDIGADWFITRWKSEHDELVGVRDIAPARVLRSRRKRVLRSR
jgi:hypothetical protein